MLLVATVGVPLMVHVLLSMFKPFGRLGEATQLVALVRLVMNEFKLRLNVRE